MQENYLQDAKAEAKIDKLPEPSLKRFEGLAVAKVRKVGGRIVYAVCHYDEGLKKPLIARDFCRGNIQEIIEVYPDPKQISLTSKEILDGLKEKLVKEGYEPEDVKGWNTDKCAKELELVIRTKNDLIEMGVPSPTGSLDELLEMKKKLDIKPKKVEKKVEKKAETKSEAKDDEDSKK